MTILGRATVLAVSKAWQMLRSPWPSPRGTPDAGEGVAHLVSLVSMRLRIWSRGIAGLSAGTPAISVASFVTFLPKLRAESVCLFSNYAEEI